MSSGSQPLAVGTRLTTIPGRVACRSLSNQRHWSFPLPGIDIDMGLNRPNPSAFTLVDRKRSQEVGLEKRGTSWEKLWPSIFNFLRLLFLLVDQSWPGSDMSLNCQKELVHMRILLNHLWFDLSQNGTASKLQSFQIKTRKLPLHPLRFARLC